MTAKIDEVAMAVNSLEDRHQCSLRFDETTTGDECLVRRDRQNARLPVAMRV